MIVDPSSTAEGYLTIPLLDRDTVRRLRNRFERLDLPIDHGFHATSANNTRQTAQAVDAHLKAVLGPVLRPLVSDHDPFLAAFISKGARAGVAVDYHQDWTYTDERRHRAILFWIPLVDTTDANGALCVVPGSHRWTTGLRASGGSHATGPLQPSFATQSVMVELEAGYAFVYDPALVHGSLPNATAHARPAAAIALVPRAAPLVHFHVDTADHLSGWLINGSHFTTQPFGSCPQQSPPIEPWDRLVSTRDLAEHLAR